MTLYPLADKVIIQQEEAPDRTESGLYIPSSAKEKPNIGTVISRGSGRYENGNLVPMQTQVGNKVIYSKFSGTEIEIEDKKYIILRENDILAIIK